MVATTRHWQCGGQGPEAQLYYKKLNKNERHSLSWRKTIKLMNGQKKF